MFLYGLLINHLSVCVCVCVAGFRQHAHYQWIS